jgi:hypothetical protein
MRNKNNSRNKINSTPIFLENKAQAGAVFRLMIDAIIGLVILASILSTMAYFEQQQVSLALREFETLLTSAVNSPDGTIIESENLIFMKGTTYTTRSFEAMTQHPRECFFIQGGIGSLKVMGDGESIEFLQRTQIKIYAKCEVQGGNCPYYCTISFGRKIN